MICISSDDSVPNVWLYRCGSLLIVVAGHKWKILAHVRLIAAGSTIIVMSLVCGRLLTTECQAPGVLEDAQWANPLSSSLGQGKGVRKRPPL